MSRAAQVLEKLTQAQRREILSKVGTKWSKQVVSGRAKDGWTMTDRIFLDKEGKPKLVSMTKGNGIIIIHPGGLVDTYLSIDKVPYKEA